MASLPNDGSFFENFQRLQGEAAAEKAEKEAAEAAAEAVDTTGTYPDSLPPLPIDPSSNISLPVEYSAASSSNSESLFLPSASFTGPLTGYIFKNGDAGLGGFRCTR